MGIPSFPLRVRSPADVRRTTSRASTLGALNSLRVNFIQFLDEFAAIICWSKNNDTKTRCPRGRVQLEIKRWKGCGDVLKGNSSADPINPLIHLAYIKQRRKECRD